MVNNQSDQGIPCQRNPACFFNIHHRNCPLQWKKMKHVLTFIANCPSLCLNRGTVRGYTYAGQTVDFVCDPGWERHGPAQSTCLEDGTWTNAVPECKYSKSLSFLYLFFLFCVQWMFFLMVKIGPISCFCRWYINHVGDQFTLKIDTYYCPSHLWKLMV